MLHAIEGKMRSGGDGGGDEGGIRGVLRGIQVEIAKEGPREFELLSHSSTALARKVPPVEYPA